MMKEVLFRVNAGLNVGLGHLSRCMNLAREISKAYPVSFCICTEQKEYVEGFIYEIKKGVSIKKTIFFSQRDPSSDVDFLVHYTQEYNAFLVLDHYDVTEDYQMKLKDAGVHWLQLDSHAGMRFYGDLVQHGSPGATEALYKDLHGSLDTRFLLGPKYVIVNNEYAVLHELSKIRRKLSKVFVSFGGGYAKGALMKYLEPISKAFPQLDFCAVFRGNHPDKDKLMALSSERPNVHLYIDYPNIPELMLNCDLGILASGGMSYEAATLGLPLVLIAMEDNQYVNLAGCARIGISCSLGHLDDVTADSLCEALSVLMDDDSKLADMSNRALEEFDGKGVERIVSVLIQRMKQL